VSPDNLDGSVGINQDAYFSLGNLDAGKSLAYKIKKSGNGVYVFVLEGSLEIDGETLNRRDGMGISEIESFEVKASSDAEVLLMEVPMS
jgi:redox-sensitive bicupin YhaK (pirin superfamily)